MTLAHHRTGTCAIEGRKPPPTRDTLLNPVPTLCGMCVIVPTRYSRGVPSCEACRKAIAAKTNSTGGPR